MIDTHAHLTKQFCEDTEKGVGAALKEGVKKIVLAASNVEESRENIELSKKYPGVLFPVVGIHPQQTDTESVEGLDKQLSQIEELIVENRDLVVGVGETGLDYSPAPEGEKDRTKEEQQKLFEAQIELGRKYGLAIVIHARKAMNEVIETVEVIEKEEGVLKGVFHCYVGGKKRIERILNLKGEWYFGIDGNLTYEDGLCEVVKKIPKERLVLETDSPFLTPVPHRGEVNSPANVRFVYKKVAEVWEVEVKEVIERVGKNATKLFSL